MLLALPSALCLTQIAAVNFLTAGRDVDALAFTYLLHRCALVHFIVLVIVK